MGRASPNARWCAMGPCSRVILQRYVSLPGQKTVLTTTALLWANADSFGTPQSGDKVIAGGADKQGNYIDLTTGQKTQFAQHDQPIKSVRYFEANGVPMAATGSWDKMVKYWDFRAQAPIGQLQVQERVYSMDVRDNLLVIGTADRYINVVNLREPTKLYKTMQSPLKWQTRVVSCFTDSQGFAIGSIEGRCAIQYVEDKDAR